MAVEQFVGIFADAMRRVPMPDAPWTQHRYSFVFEQPMRREQIVARLAMHYHDRSVPHSA